jgi:hypothetical protein
VIQQANRIWIVLGQGHRGQIVRGHAYVERHVASAAARDADEDYPGTAPHRVVPFVPEVAR